MGDYYLLLRDSIVVGWQSHTIATENLAENEVIKSVKTDNPEAYIGLDISQIYLDPLPVPEESESYKETQQWRRWKLKQLYLEIKFTEAIEEDVVALQSEFDDLLLEYNSNKE
jgi:hypothetical protein